MTATEEITTIEHAAPRQVIRTTKQVSPSIRSEPPQKVFEKKKTIFRFYQVIWYGLGIVETLLLFRFVLKAFGANPFSGFASFIYAVTEPLALPFQGIFPTPGSGIYVVEWSTIIAMVVYALFAYGIIEIFQFVKPVSQEEVEQTVDEQ